MAHRHSGGRSGTRASVRHLTHKFPGEHFLIVRPARDDIRRSTMDAPRRGRRVRARQRRKDDRKISKLARDTHKGKLAKTQQNSSGGRQMPQTAKSRPMGSNSEVRISRQVGKVGRGHKPVKSTGLSPHRPRALNPHAPRLYHVFPVKRISEHLFR